MTTEESQQAYPSPMVEEYLKASRSVMKKVLVTKASARRFLQDAGIIDAKGNLTKPYRQAGHIVLPSFDV